jgi:uronate dehydrogenase
MDGARSARRSGRSAYRSEVVTIRPRSSRVLITGAAGRIGTYLRERLSSADWELRLLDREAFDDDRDVVIADIRDPAALEAAMRGVDAVVHLAGISTEAPLADILAMNVEGTWRVFDAARRAGVARVVYGGRNHAIGFTPRCELLRTDVELRPDTNYGVSKAFGETVGRFYADRYGMRVACLRIGSCDDRPRSPRMLATWLSPDDAARLVESCLSSANLQYAVVYGISANTRAWWDLEPGRALGYEPEDDAEVFADEVFDAYEPAPGEDAEHSFVGGRWTTFSAS